MINVTINDQRRSRRRISRPRLSVNPSHRRRPTSSKSGRAQQLGRVIILTLTQVLLLCASTLCHRWSFGVKYHHIFGHGFSTIKHIPTIISPTGSLWICFDATSVQQLIRRK
jgi:hypothetical protein